MCRQTAGLMTLSINWRQKVLLTVILMEVFGGDRLMTRYEMAQIVAKAMAKGANVDRLAAEFADELDSLGVRVAGL